MAAKIRVLIVDDEERFALNLAKILNRRGFLGTAVFDGVAAVDRVRNEDPFDVVVLDIKMPKMDGIETLERIKNLSPQTEVIMLTGHATLESGVQAMRMGAFDYLMKPCDTEDLIEKIKEAHETERIKRQPVLWTRNTVGDCTLYSFKQLTPQESLEKAVGVFYRKTYTTGAETVYIQDENGQFVGCVTKRDLLEAAEKAHPARTVRWTDVLEHPDLLPQRPLGSVMRSEVPLTTTPQENLTDAANRMILNHIRSMPVVQGGKVIGIVRLRDILQYVDHEIE